MIARCLVIISMVLGLHHSNGTLTLIVRAIDGHLAAGVEIALWEDRDVDGRSLVTTARTDMHGALVFRDLPHATYAIEFLGQWNGQALQPVERQNQTELGDTGGIRGFGLRFSEPELTRLFVLAPTADNVVPHWDEARSLDEASRPLLLAPLPLNDMPEDISAVVATPVPARGPSAPSDSPPAEEQSTTPRRPTRTTAYWWLLPLGCGIVGSLLLASDWVQRRRCRAAEDAQGEFHA